MKSHRFMLFVVLLSLSIVAFAQSAAQRPIAPKSEAQKSFDTLKTLAGEWEGQLTVDPPQPDMNNGKPELYWIGRNTIIRSRCFT